MPKLLQINITANWGSHGKIAENIGTLVIENGWESHIAYGRWYNESKSHLYHIGNMTDEYIHGIASRIFDNHGLMSVGATKKLIDHIQDFACHTGSKPISESVRYGLRKPFHMYHGFGCFHFSHKMTVGIILEPCLDKLSSFYFLSIPLLLAYFSLF